MPPLHLSVQHKKKGSVFLANVFLVLRVVACSLSSMSTRSSSASSAKTRTGEDTARSPPSSPSSSSSSSSAKKRGGDYTCKTPQGQGSKRTAVPQSPTSTSSSFSSSSSAKTRTAPRRGFGGSNGSGDIGGRGGSGGSGGSCGSGGSGGSGGSKQQRMPCSEKDCTRTFLDSPQGRAGLEAHQKEGKCGKEEKCVRSLDELVDKPLYFPYEVKSPMRVVAQRLEVGLTTNPCNTRLVACSLSSRTATNTYVSLEALVRHSIHVHASLWGEALVRHSIHVHASLWGEAGCAKEQQQPDTADDKVSV